jgi:hypothetical protein
MVQSTSLPTNLTAGQTGHIGNSNTVHNAVNAVTLLLNGITDFVTAVQQAVASGTQSADILVDGTNNKVFTSADDAKLAILDATSDLSKPVSTAQATAIATKANFINSTKFVRKDPVTGFWPASYATDGTPVYTGGSASAGVRPTSSLVCCVFWIGADPSPGTVASGSGGMMQGIDQRIITT